MVDGPAGGHRYPGATRETQNSYKGVGSNDRSAPGYMLVKQFSAAGEFLGTVAGIGTDPSTALAIRRPQSSPGVSEYGTVTMNTTFKKDVMDLAFNVGQELTANQAEALADRKSTRLNSSPW